MPPKGKAGNRAKNQASTPSGTSPSSTTAPDLPTTPQPPRTVYEQSRQRYYLTRPYAEAIERAGISSLSASDRAIWASAQYLGASANAAPARRSSSSSPLTSSSRLSPALLSNKAQKELWRCVNEASLPLRALKPPPPTSTSASASAAPWGRDRYGRDIGEYTLDEFRDRSARRLRLTALEVAHRAFLGKRAQAQALASLTAPAHSDSDSDSRTVWTLEVDEERQRRREIARLRMELYGERLNGPYAQDPDWDDVEPIPLTEPEGALAAIAYPDNYAESISYLRAVMEKNEYSPRSLRLTEDVIAQNPAHYTVWLYRFSIVRALQLPIADELSWLNDVAFENLKNYQIWHHRYLLVEQYYSQLTGTEASERVAEFARSEMDFLTRILAEDTKNYHVWSYRQYLVRKLRYWTDAERQATEAFIRQDVRNNSAWSHRFFLVFGAPGTKPADDGAGSGAVATTTTGLNNLSLSSSHPPAPTTAVIDREIAFAQGRIREAPQNESPWNYLRGVLTKSGRPLATIEAFAAPFAANIGAGSAAEEVVQSTHAMDVLATIYEQQGDTQRASLYLARLADKWDPIRAGYWSYRQQLLKEKGGGDTAEAVRAVEASQAVET